jgi:hypothetical protein
MGDQAADHENLLRRGLLKKSPLLVKERLAEEISFACHKGSRRLDANLDIKSIVGCSLRKRQFSDV